MCGTSARTAKRLGRRLNQHQGLRPGNKLGITTSVQRCRRCGLVFANPLPIPQTLSAHYDVAPGEYFSPRLWSLVQEQTFFAEQIRRFFELWTGQARPRALDVGAGVGASMSSLERAGFETYGLEPSASFRDFAISHSNISPDRLNLASIQNASYKHGSFDFITFGAVLEHLPDPAAALVKALEWLAPHGLIHLEVPSPGWLLARLIDWAYGAQRLDYTTHLSPLHPPYHLFEFTVESFTVHGYSAGYEVASHKCVPVTMYTPRWLAPALLNIMRATNTGLQLEVWLRPTPTHT